MTKPRTMYEISLVFDNTSEMIRRVPGPLSIDVRGLTDGDGHLIVSFDVEAHSEEMVIKRPSDGKSVESVEIFRL